MMKKTKCVSVRLSALVSISDRAYKAVAFDGSEDIIPKSQVFGQDFDVQKSEAYWISEWIMQQKNIQYSNKKIGWFNHNTKSIEPSFNTIVEKHIPKKIKNINVKQIKELER